MSKFSAGKLGQSLAHAAKKNAPKFLMALGAAGMFAAGVKFAEATPKAKARIKERTEEWNEENGTTDEPLPKIEAVKATWKFYVPTAVIGGVSTLCFAGASSANTRRNAALATAYALSESSFKEYREKVVETIGEKKEQSVRDSIAKDKIDQNPVSKREVIITDSGDTLCFDVLSGRYFKSDIDRLRRAAVDLNMRMIDEMYVTVNDFYYEIGLKDTKMGDLLGWNINDGKLDLHFSSQLDEKGRPCLVLDYQVAPRYDFQRR